MDSVEIIDEPCCEKAVALRNEVAEYTEQVFTMFGGKQENVTLKFDRSLIGVVYDKFGEDTKMIPSGENECIANVKVQISPTFWGWLFQFGNQMKITSPKELNEEYIAKADSSRDILGRTYEEGFRLISGPNFYLREKDCYINHLRRKQKSTHLPWLEDGC